MDHPLRSAKNKVLRSRVVQLLTNGFSIIRQTNIVFVCGGNAENDMRTLFKSEFGSLLPSYEYFVPESAMTNYFSFGDTEPFDIADFESLVAELSIAIVLFPEAPGSFAELGYFSGQDKLASKTLLVLDSNHQKSGSFISLGPASKISEKSVFRMPIQMDYTKPDFTLVSTRILEHAKLTSRMQRFQPKAFDDLTAFGLFSLIHKLVSLLVVATGEDIESILRSMFKSNVYPSKIKKIISILVGSGRLVEVGDYGHLTASKDRSFALTLVDGAKTELTELSVDISATLYAPESELASVLEELD